MAVAAGSRGIDRYAEVVAAVVATLRSAGALPFVMPAMGSHGGGTAPGQVEVLESLGITEATVGAPIVSHVGDGGAGAPAPGLPRAHGAGRARRPTRSSSSTA